MDPRDQARQIGVVESWLSQTYVYGELVNPGAAVAIAQTPQMAQGWYDIYYYLFIGAADPNVIFEAQHLDGSLTVFRFRMKFGAAAASFYYLPVLNQFVTATDVLRLYINLNWTGVVTGAIRAQRRT